MWNASADAPVNAIRWVGSWVWRSTKATWVSSCRTWRSRAGPASDGRRYGGRARLPAKRFERELVKGWLHQPEAPSGDGLALTHGAGADSETALLRAVAEELSAAGLWVLRFDLPFRQVRPHGPPFPAQAARDREGAQRATEALR